MPGTITCVQVQIWKANISRMEWGPGRAWHGQPLIWINYGCVWQIVPWAWVLAGLGFVGTSRNGAGLPGSAHSPTVVIS